MFSLSYNDAYEKAYNQGIEIGYYASLIELIRREKKLKKFLGKDELNMMYVSIAKGDKELEHIKELIKEKPDKTNEDIANILIHS
jgi:hypothetical protein